MSKTIQKITAKITNDHNEEHHYVFEPNALDAIQAAIDINRPLLIRGEPGVGKSQLAKASAAHLGRTYIPFVVNASTEAKDLLWSFDAIARLADAQIEGALCTTETDQQKIRENLALYHYIKPAPLWAALNWQSAETQYDNTHDKDNSPLPHYFNADKAKTKGVVVLIDEIDKADSSVPNGLLEVLGANRFHPDGLGKAVEVDQAAPKPLIIITTNEERILPDAFIRRCLSITLGLPEQRKEQINYLVAHAKPNFKMMDKSLLELAANMILDDREYAKHLHPLPGQAEYFDLLRGIEAQRQDMDTEELTELVEKLSLFTSKKHPDFPKSAIKT